MKRYNVIFLLNPAGDRLLMCRRRREPYRGLLNLVGGKIEDGEDHLRAAYRELAEETGITEQDAALTHLMDFTITNRIACLRSTQAGCAAMLPSTATRTSCCGCRLMKTFSTQANLQATAT